MSDPSVQTAVIPLQVAETISAFLRAVERRSGGRPLLTRVYGSPRASKLVRRPANAVDGRTVPLSFDRS